MTFRIHSDDSHIPCPNCTKMFLTKQELSHHLKVCTNNGDKFTCSECGSSFISQEALSLHIKLHNGDTTLVNDICTLTSNLQNPSFPLNMPNLTPMQPMQVNKPYIPAPPISTAASKAAKKTHICPHCSKGFSAKHGLQQHKKRHPQGTCALKSHVCAICGKGFYQKNHLLLHQRQHMDLKNTSLSLMNKNGVDNNNVMNEIKAERGEVGKNDGKDDKLQIV